MLKPIEVVRALLPLIIMTYAQEHSFHGYALIKMLRKRLDVYFGPSTIYPILNELSDLGMLRGKWEMSERRRPIKVYYITQEGREVAGQLNATLNTTIQVISNFNGKNDLEIVRPKSPHSFWVTVK